jgi:hypothetical protein
MHVARLHRPLIAVAALMIAVTAVSLAGLALDDRLVAGVPAWLKPFKFAVSIAVYTTTVAWLLSLLAERRRRLGWWLGTVIAAMLALEMVAIVGQAARGRMSHFNNVTPQDTVIYALMGVTIAVVWVATLVLAVLLLIQRLPERDNALAVRFGLVLALAGMGVGFLMTMPTSAQLAGGDAPTVIGAHSVGVEDGGAGLPLVGWSTTGGDLRIGHFIGMHALQFLPLFALALSMAARRSARLRVRAVRVRLIGVAGSAYAALTALLTWQALRAQPLADPDPLTLAAAGAIALATAGGVVWALSARPAGPDVLPVAEPELAGVR